jgi:hypothetical protein
METIAVVLSVGNEHVPAFESGFREQEVPIWQDLRARGVLTRASLTKMDISSRGVDGATQYLIVAVFETGEGHHEHDNDPRFAAWNERADAFQIAPAMAFGGETIVREG